MPAYCWKFVLAIIVVLISIHTCDATCRIKGWYGEHDCQYRCRCADVDGCNSETGECQGGCAKGWFGPSCQYEILSFRAVDNLSRQVADGNDGTCTFFYNVLNARLNSPQRVTWIRLILLDETHHDQIQISYKTTRGIRNCTGRGVVRVNRARRLDIFCPSRDLVTHVKLTRENYTSICSVYISSGQICPPGVYGLGCNHDCRCAGDSASHPVTGECANGCVEGSEERVCNTVATNAIGRLIKRPERFNSNGRVWAISIPLIFDIGCIALALFMLDKWQTWLGCRAPVDSTPALVNFRKDSDESPGLPCDNHTQNNRNLGAFYL